jgi:hypothetical protein
VAPSSTAHGPEAIPFGLNKKQKRTDRSWDEQFQELVDYKKNNGHTNVSARSGPIGKWVSHQRAQYRLFTEGQDSSLTNEKCEKLESIGFVFKLRPTGTRTPCWNERFQELVDFKKINGHTNVPKRSGPLGAWVHKQRPQYRLLKEGKYSTLTNDKCEKLESIGFVFKGGPTVTPWDERFKELVDFKKSNGHMNVPQRSGTLGLWVTTQRTQYRLFKEEKHSVLTNEKCEKLESIGFVFKLQPTGLFLGISDFKN